MDTREILQLLRWLESAETELSEYRRQSVISRDAANQQILTRAQIIAVRRRLMGKRTTMAA